MKKILSVFIATAFMAWSYYLITVILSSAPTNYNLGLTILNSLMVTAAITGVFAFTGFVFTTHKLFGSSYYKIRSPELLITIYKLLGISFFRAGMIFSIGVPRRIAPSISMGLKKGCKI